MIYHKKPEGFKPKYEVVSCFMEADGEILLLHRNSDKLFPNTWGVPGGKMEPNEERLYAIIREIGEETGFRPLLTEPRFKGTVYFRSEDFDFIQHIYHLVLPIRIDVTVNPEEHKSFFWISPKRALKMPLMRGLEECIKLFYDI